MVLRLLILWWLVIDVVVAWSGVVLVLMLSGVALAPVLVLFGVVCCARAGAAIKPSATIDAKTSFTIILLIGDSPGGERLCSPLSFKIT